MQKELPYHVLAFYHFIRIENPHEEVAKHKVFFEGKDITSRIYISEQGINGQMSASREAAKAYQEWMHSRPEFKDVVFKIHDWHEQVFPRQIVKYRRYLVAYGKELDLSKRGKHVSPKEWKEMLQSDENFHMVDVRNEYEWRVGHFDGADLPPCETFREFEKYAENLAKVKDPKNTPVMMYCTGGIRCEIYSSALLEKGFEKVYQLDGGIINYGLKEGSEHWLGKLYVFDDRMAVPISEEEAPVVGKCHFCEAPIEAYYNCANMDCNFIFLCCPQCLKANSGCCKESCCNAPRVRPYHHQNPHKPFRRKHLLDLHK